MPVIEDSFSSHETAPVGGAETGCTSRIEVTPASNMTTGRSPCPCPRRREAVLERAEVVGVDVVGLRVALALQLGLRLEAHPLLDRVVELAEGVRDLAAPDDELEALGERRVVAVGVRASGETSIG